MVESTVKRIGGTVSIRSKPGVGCAFTVRVPYYHLKIDILPLRVGNHSFGLFAHLVKGAEKAADLSFENETSSYGAWSLFGEKKPMGSLLKIVLKNGSSWWVEEAGAVSQGMIRQTKIGEVAGSLLIGLAHGDFVLSGTESQLTILDLKPPER
jgi:hypothetical protein